MDKEHCNCELGFRAWNPITGNCETCGRRYKMIMFDIDKENTFRQAVREKELARRAKGVRDDEIRREVAAIEYAASDGKAYPDEHGFLYQPDDERQFVTVCSPASDYTHIATRVGRHPKTGAIVVRTIAAQSILNDTPMDANEIVLSGDALYYLIELAVNQAVPAAEVVADGDIAALIEDGYEIKKRNNAGDGYWCNHQKSNWLPPEIHPSLAVAIEAAKRHQAKRQATAAGDDGAA